MKDHNKAFPTIVTSGTILSAAGILIYFLTSEPAITAIGQCLGRGTLISMYLVMGVLPQILVLGDVIIEKTSFIIKTPEVQRKSNSTLRVHGRVRGYVNGIVDAEIHGIIQGNLSARVDAGGLEDLGVIDTKHLPAAEEEREVESHENK